MNHSEQILFTIGYEGKSIEAFIDSLIKNDVRLLCDVRKNPFSRKPGFSKKMLEHTTQTAGINYIHIPELGIEREKRNSLKTPEDQQRLFEDYAKSLPDQKALLDEVYMLLQSNARIALMCYELKPEMCHRHIIRDYIVEAYKVKSEDL